MTVELQQLTCFLVGGGLKYARAATGTMYCLHAIFVIQALRSFSIVIIKVPWLRAGLIPFNEIVNEGEALVLNGGDYFPLIRMTHLCLN